MGYILCQVKRAKTPYYIESISMNIYSIEELCYYIYHNIYLLDETIINEGLCFWIKNELHLTRLYQKLFRLLDERGSIGEFILPVFKEINYLSFAEFKEINKQLKVFEEQPEVVRLKMKGDYLFNHEKYINAIRVYTQAQKKAKDSNLGAQFLGSIYNNMGCAYVRLFQTEEAFECFGQANEILHSGASLRSYLYSAYFNKGKDTYERLCDEKRVDSKTKQEMDDKIRKAQEVVLPKDIDQLLDGWTHSYHRNTGL